MSVEGFSPTMRSSTSMLAPISDWGTRLIAPLGSSLLSKDGMIELAGRVYWIVGLVIGVVIIARKYGYLTGRATTDAPLEKQGKKLEQMEQQNVTSDSTTLQQQLKQYNKLLKQQLVLLKKMFPSSLNAAQQAEQISLLEKREKELEEQGKKTLELLEKRREK
jgi:hypothetical protein